MAKIYTYFGFKKGKLVSVLQSLDNDAKKAFDCNCCISEPQEFERQINEWKRESQPNNMLIYSSHQKEQKVSVLREKSLY